MGPGEIAKPQSVYCSCRRPEFISTLGSSKLPVTSAPQESGMSGFCGYLYSQTGRHIHIIKNKQLLKSIERPSKAQQTIVRRMEHLCSGMGAMWSNPYGYRLFGCDVDHAKKGVREDSGRTLRGSC